MIKTIIQKLDEADARMREDLEEYKGMAIGEKDAYQKARNLIEEAITILLRYI